MRQVERAASVIGGDILHAGSERMASVSTDKEEAVQPASAAHYSSSRRHLLGVLAVAAVARIAWAVLVPVVPITDSHAYDVFAQNLAAGVGYCWEAGQPTAYWPVGTSLVYSLFYRAFGVTYVPLVVLNLLVGVAIIAATMWLAKAWFGDQVALAAGLLLALWPSQIQFTTVLASELLFNGLLLLSLLISFREWNQRPRCAAASGVVLAAASLVRPTALLLPLVYGIVAVARGCAKSRVACGVIVTSVVMVVCILPWTVRNYRVFGEFVLISTNGGTNTWMGNNPDTDGGYMTLPKHVLHLPEPERNRVLAAEARAYIMQHPFQFIKRSLVKLVRLHERESIGIAWNEKGLSQRLSSQSIFILKLSSNFYWWGVLGCALVGIGLLVRQVGVVKTLFHPVVFLWAYFSAVHAVTVIQDRYHFPSIPLIAILAGITIVGVVNRGRSFDLSHDHCQSTTRGG